MNAGTFLLEIILKKGLCISDKNVYRLNKGTSFLQSSVFSPSFSPLFFSKSNSIVFVFCSSKAINPGERATNSNNSVIISNFILKLQCSKKM